MKSYLILCITIVLLLSCSQSSELQKAFPCKSSESYNNLKETKDVRKLFSISFPKHWKTNLYYDNAQSSIFSADTTKQLTKTTLIDATIIHEATLLDTKFKEKTTLNNNSLGLTTISSKSITFLEKPSYYNLAKGKKGKYNYQLLTLFVQVNSANFLHIKTEVYGDESVEERFCKAIKLLEKIQLQ